MSEPRPQSIVVPPTHAHARPHLEPATPPRREPDQALEALVEEELLVEDVSIDGMCGVY